MVPDITLSSVVVATLSCVRTCHDIYTMKTWDHGRLLCISTVVQDMTPFGLEGRYELRSVNENI